MSISNPKKRFLILTGDAGFGHRSAAKSVASALEENHHGESVTWIIDPVIERPSPMLLRKTQLDYDHTVSKYQEWYRFTYDISDSRPASSFVEGALTMLLYRNMQQIIAEFKPDAVLTTLHLFNAPLGSLIYTQRKNIPFFTVVTDLADVHALWFQASPDHFFVASEAVRAQALNCNIPDKKITVSGIPVNPNLAKTPHEKALTRRMLGLEPDRPTLLFVGSRRVNGILECLETLQNCSIPIQVLVAAGGDEQLFKEVSGQSWNFPLHCENYVQNMPDWMNCSDLLITKAGGLILSEGLAAGLPIILIDNLPGQEDGNVRFITENQAGVRVQNEIELFTVVKAWLSNDAAALHEIAAHSRALGHPRSAIDIADAIWQASLIGIPHAGLPLPQPIRWMRAHEQHLD
jgi:1,2-diacylglycerol 3-beta-galactosyltransferase